MSYQVLARKWRPQVFEDVVGQQHIIRTLQNAITTGRLAHAFLFSGPRGVGKTTTARILAKALNCAQGPTPSPCGVCDQCRETAAGTAVDVIEIDGASNRGIEHIRELREAVRYAPAGAKYKVYVIDEVHMLTNEAFNALLKTLEEPPPHVIFIFATTEPQKIPATIHSRCQRYGFKRIALGDLSKKLRDIAEAEKIQISDNGLAMIARVAEGSMRDSQSLLDQAVSYSGTAITDQDIQILLGSVGQEILSTFTADLIARNAAELLKHVDTMLEQGQDMRQFLAGVVEYLRNLLIAKMTTDPGGIIELPPADIETIRQSANHAGTEHLLLLFDSLSKTLDEMRWSLHQRFTLEVGLIKACSLNPLKPLSDVLERLKKIEGRVGPSGPAPVPGGLVREEPAQYASSAPSAPQQQGAADTGHGDTWQNIQRSLKARKPALASALVNSMLMDEKDGELVIGVRGSSFQMDLIEKKDNRSLIEKTASALLNKKMLITFKHLGNSEKAPPKGTASKKMKKEADDPGVQDALRIFGGRVIETDHPGE